MSSSLIGGVVGAVIGSFIPGVGTALGYAIGAGIGGLLGPKPKQPGPGDLTAPGLTLGSAAPRFYGTYRLPCMPIWISGYRATEHEADGKGAPEGPSSFTYSCDALFLIADGANAQVDMRVWRNKKLVWSARSESDQTSIDNSENTETWASKQLYTGGPSQMPADTYEDAVGTANAPANRDMCTLLIRDVQCGGTKQLPAFEVEVTEQATSTTYGDGLLCHFDSETGGIVPSALGPDVTLGSGNSIEPGVSVWGGAADATQVAGPYPGAIGVTGSTARSWRMEIIVEPTVASGPLFSLSSTASGYHIDISAVIGTAAFGVNYVADGSSGGGVIGSSAAGPQLGQRNHVGVEYEEGSNMLYLFCNGSRVGEIGPFAGAPFGDAVFDTVLVGGCGRVYEAYFHFDDPLYGPAYSVPSGPFTDSDTVVYTPQTVTLAHIVTSELLRIPGMTEADFDVTDLEDTEVIGYACVGSALQAVADLRDTFYLDIVPGRPIKFVRRGRAPVYIIPYSDTGSGVAQATAPFAGVKESNPDETPAVVGLRYPAQSRDGEPGFQRGDRLTTETPDVTVVDTRVVLTDEQAKGRALTGTLLARARRRTANFALSDRYPALEPGDSLLATDNDGIQALLRCVRFGYSDGVRQCDWESDDPSALIEAGITDVTDTPSFTVATTPPSEMLLMDIAPLRDSEATSPGHLVAATAASAGTWPGAAILRAAVADGDRSEVARVLERAVLGAALTALSANPPLWRVDRYGTLEVRVLGTLSSSTTAAMQADRTVNALAVETSDGGFEVIRFQTATLLSTDGEYRIYRLSGLRRGRRGTEQLVGLHAVGDRVVLLRTAGIRNVATEPVDLGVTRYYRAVTLGRSAASASEQAFADNGARMKPFAPTRVRMEVAGGRNRFTWRRRSRYLPRYGGPSGTLVPLGEASEAYDVELRDASDVLVASETVTEQEWSLSALQQGVHLLVPSWGLRVISGELVGVRDDVLGTYTTTKYLVRHDAATGVFIAQSPAVGEEVYQIVNSGDDIYLVVADYTNTVPVAWASTSLLKFNRTSLGSATASYTSATPGDFQGVAFDGTNVWVTESLTGQLRRFDTSLASTGTFAINAGITALVHDSGSLWICDVANDELIEWDIATTTELQRFPVTPNPFDVLIVGSRAFVFGTTGLGVYDTADGSVIVEHSTPPVFFAGAQAQRQMLLFDGYVAIAGSDSGHLVILHDAVTGAEVSRSASTYESLSYLAGSDGDTLYLTGEPVAPGSTSKQTDGFTFENADLSGYSFTVAQRSAVVVRGYSTTITL